jgi:hypothetical protein
MNFFFEESHITPTLAAPFGVCTTGLGTNFPHMTTVGRCPAAAAAAASTQIQILSAVMMMPIE